MIHAGTITTGSGRTRAVAGAYWMISASGGRGTTRPGGGGAGAPPLWAPVPRRSAAAGGAHGVVEEVHPALDEVHPAGLTRSRQHLRIRGDEVGRRDRVLRLAGEGGRHVLVMLANTAHAGGGG